MQLFLQLFNGKNSLFLKKAVIPVKKIGGVAYSAYSMKD